jgi:hypothetical protein
MKKILALFACIFFVTPAWAINFTDLIATSTTTVTLSTSSAISDDTFGQAGNYLRLNCTVACWVAVMLTNTSTALASSPYLYLPANETAYVKAPGTRYIIALGGDAGTLTITAMSP